MQPLQVLQAAHKARPDLLEKVATAVALVSMYDEDYEKELVESLRRIISYTSEKTAAADFKGFGMALGGTLVAGLGASLATDLYDEAKRGLTKSRNFKRVMEMNPELKQYDKKTLKTSFDTLHRYTPEFTADPIMGGSLMTAMVQSPSSSVQLVKDLIGARKNLLDSKSRQYAPGRIELGDPDRAEMLSHALSSERDREKDLRQHGLSLKRDVEKDHRQAVSRDFERRRAEGSMNLKVLSNLEKEEKRS